MNTIGYSEMYQCLVEPLIIHGCNGAQEAAVDPVLGKVDLILPESPVESSDVFTDFGN